MLILTFLNNDPFLALLYVKVHRGRSGFVEHGWRRLLDGEGGVAIAASEKKPPYVGLV
jgi:hypothetical protein